MHSDLDKLDKLIDDLQPWIKKFKEEGYSLYPINTPIGVSIFLEITHDTFGEVTILVGGIKEVEDMYAKLLESKKDY